jgi:hypothetical protein
VRTWLAVALLPLLLAGCGDGTTDDEQARQAAGIHQVAQELVERPGVLCARGDVDTQGLPQAPRGSLLLNLTTTGLDRPDQEQLLRDAAERVWRSDLAVSLLNLDLRNDDGLAVRLADVLETETTSVRAADLEREFGEQPAGDLPLPELDDPGNPDC